MEMACTPQCSSPRGAGVRRFAQVGSGISRVVDLLGFEARLISTILLHLVPPTSVSLSTHACARGWGGRRSVMLTLSSCPRRRASETPRENRADSVAQPPQMKHSKVRAYRRRGWTICRGCPGDGPGQTNANILSYRLIHEPSSTSCDRRAMLRRCGAGKARLFTRSGERLPHPDEARMVVPVQVL